MKYTVYLVEDDPNLNQVLTSYLQNQGWDVRYFLNGREARQAITTEPQLWILDIMLPDIHGYELIREIRSHNPHTPVIFISARDAELDRVFGLELGGDDYITKPFLPKELIIRAQKLLDRIYGPQRCSKLRFGPYELDTQSRIATEGTEALHLTSREFDLLLYLAQNTNRALTRDQILTGVWGVDYFGSDRVVDDLIRRIRQRMPKIRIETIYGYGYRVSANEE